MADMVKDDVARVVQRMAEETLAARLAMVLALYPDQIEVHPVDKLNTQVRVKMPTGMPRYFNVKVSEQL